MLTLAKVQTYERFEGDIDGFSRIRGRGDSSGITEEDFFLIDQLCQSLHLAASRKASDSFRAEVEQRLHAATTDDLTRDALRRIAVRPLRTLNDIATSPFTWWNARRVRYNVGLVVAGILAFMAYVAVGSTMLPPDADFEVTIFTTAFHGVGYLFMIGVANVLYFLGPLSELVIHPRNPERYRRICFRLGFWFSVLLPFSIPALLATLAVFDPSSFPRLTSP